MKRSLLCLVVTLCIVTLLRGDEAIRSLQQTLKDRGFYYGAITGDKSVETTAAVRRYQIRNGLKVTGEVNEETLRSVNSNAVASASHPASKPATIQPNSVRSDASAQLSQSSPPPSQPASKPATIQSETVRPNANSAYLSQSSPPPSFRQPDRPVETNPSYSASFYQPPPIRLNRQIIAGVQNQLMSLGYYRGRVDGRDGRQMASALRAFQSSAGLPPTGRLNVETIKALGSSGTDFADSAPVHRYENWVPVSKFKHGRWKVKWKKDHRSFGGEQDQQANSEPHGDPNNQ